MWFSYALFAVLLIKRARIKVSWQALVVVALFCVVSLHLVLVINFRISYSLLWCMRISASMCSIFNHSLQPIWNVQWILHFFVWWNIYLPRDYTIALEIISFLVYSELPELELLSSMSKILQWYQNYEAETDAGPSTQKVSSSVFMKLK